MLHMKPMLAVLSAKNMCAHSNTWYCSGVAALVTDIKFKLGWDGTGWGGGGC